MEPWTAASSRCSDRAAVAAELGPARRRAPGARAHPPRDPFGEPTAARPVRSLRKRIGSALAAIAALIAKFFAAIKGARAVAAQAEAADDLGHRAGIGGRLQPVLGLEFAAGFVVLLFLHEMGHVIALRREGIKASTPMFIPFLGAAIFAKSLGDNALAEARVGLAGPILGTARPRRVGLAVGEAHRQQLFLLALAYVGFLLNLFNLLPVVPLDGGRAMAAMAPWMWFLGFGALVALVFIVPEPDPVHHPAVRRHGDLAALAAAQNALARAGRLLPRVAAHRMLVGAVYIGLIVALAFGMHETHILRQLGARPQLRLRSSRAASAWPRARPRSMSRLVSRSRIVWRLS